MEIEDCATASWGGSSDSDVTSPDSDNEDRKDPLKARWKEELGMAEIVSNKGRMLKTTGISRGGSIYMFLEDALFLVEIGALHLLDDENMCIPLEDIYKKVAEGVGGSSYESFEVYRHLKSLGYIIKRHGVCWSRKCSKNVTASVEGDSASQMISENGNQGIDYIAEISELFNAMKINKLRPVFDVYPPNSNFRKTSPGNPKFILSVNSGNPPTKKQIEDLEGQCEGIPLKFCYVEHGRWTYDGVYMMYLRGGNISKSDSGMSSKLQWPMLFIISIYITYPLSAAMDDVPVRVTVISGIANSRKYAMCSANG